jgi:tetratricopeptide (TPR) repeat protein
MSVTRPEELINAEELLYNGKVEEALEIVLNFEKRSDLTPEDQLSALLLKGWVYFYQYRYNDVWEIGDLAYPLSQKLGDSIGLIESLIFKTFCIIGGQIDQGIEDLSKAEDLLTSITDLSSRYNLRINITILFLKSSIFHMKGEIGKLIELAHQNLELAEKSGDKLAIANALYSLSGAYSYKADSNSALDYAERSLKLQEEMNNFYGSVAVQVQLGLLHYGRGNYDKSLKILKKSYSINKRNNYIKCLNLTNLGLVYSAIGERDKALKYFIEGESLSDEIGFLYQKVENQMRIGIVHREKTDYILAKDYLERSLALGKKLGIPHIMGYSLFYLISIALDKNSPKQAQEYLTRYKELASNQESRRFTQGYHLIEAIFLKTSGGIQNHVEAVNLLKQIVEDEITEYFAVIIALINLCDLHLKELSMYNNAEMLDEVNSLISQLLKIAESEHLYHVLAETKLLQAKLALIQMNEKEAVKLMTEAQRIAELRGLTLLTMNISSEHDIVLEQLGTWDILKEKNAPLSERIKLASVDGVIDRLQGKRTIEPTELVDEQPTLLLILGEGGSLIFSHKFVKDFSYEEDIISGFLSAFTTFSGELFSKGLDRAKFGEDTILMESIAQFSVCYLFKGQTYPANLKNIIKQVKF